jgi:Asp-tRNA(Asn)/Glu-tRNA(Gln) amidotransferase A subunit family amidase
VQVFETARAFGAEFDDRHGQLSPSLAALIEEGREIDASSYLTALQLGRDCAASIDELFGEADVVLTPSAPGEAPHGLGSTGDPQFNRAWHLLGGPQLNVPVPRFLRRTGSNLPLGVQVVGRPGADARLLGAARWIEQQLRRAGE